jgi:hypothetical protein
MAMELFVLSDRKLASIDEWQQAIDREGFPLRLSVETPLSDVNGFLPAALRGAQTGFECDHWDAGSLITYYADVDFGHNWNYALAFRWRGSDVDEMQAAWMAGAAYARATDGVVFDLESGQVMTPPAAAQVCSDIVRDLPLMDEALQTILKKLGLQS